MKHASPEIVRRFCVVLMLTSLLIPLTSRMPAKSSGVKENVLKARTAPPSEGETRMRVSEAYGKMPLSFEPNRGQTDKAVKFLSRGPGYTLFLTSTEAVLRLNKSEDSGADKSPLKKTKGDIPKQEQAFLRMKLVNSNPAPQIAGENRLPGKSNYFIGNDRTKWRPDIPRFKGVRYSQVYQGIDLVYYGASQRQLEYDFVISPGANPERIRLSFEGADHVTLNEAGELVLTIKGGEIIQHAPVVYQEANGAKQTVAGHYALMSSDEVGFEVGEYDRSKPLVIDPQLIYATYYGGTDVDSGEGIAVDSFGNAYVAGETESPDLPFETLIHNQFNPGGSSPGLDAFVVKFNASGTDIIYATYLGGRFDEVGFAIAVASNNRAVVTGGTGDSLSSDNSSNNFPITANAFQVHPSLFNDAFVTMLSADGNSLVYSTFLGGSNRDFGAAVTVDRSAKIHMTGVTSSTDFPQRNGFQRTCGGSRDAFVTKLDPSLSGSSSLRYSSFLGSRDDDKASAIAVDNAGITYVGGATYGTNFPVKSSGGQHPFQSVNNGVNENGFVGEDGFVAKVNTNVAGVDSLVYSTYFGGDDTDAVTAIAVEPATGRVFITGHTRSTTFPLQNAFDSTLEGRDAFVAKLDEQGAGLFYSSFLGGESTQVGGGIAIDSAGNAYVTGETSPDSTFPSVNPFVTNANGSMFLAKIEATQSAAVAPKLLYSSRFGGSSAGSAIALDSKGNVYVTGSTNGGLNATPGAFQFSNVGLSDAFAVKVGSTFPDTIGIYVPAAGVFGLRNSNTPGSSDIGVLPFAGVAPVDQPLAGDWNGDGIDDVGIFRDGTFLLRQPVTVVTVINGVPVSQTVITVISIPFGDAGDIAVVGDWNGDGIDEPGVFKPSTARWTLPFHDPDNPGSTITNFPFGQAGDIPLAGDWDGDGKDGVGVFRVSTFLLTNLREPAPSADFTMVFGLPGERPVIGDWNGDGVDSIGVFFIDNTFLLVNTNINGSIFGPDLSVSFGQAGDIPIAGDWDGKPPTDNPPNSGVNDPSDGSSQVGQTQTFTTTCSDPDGWHDIATIDFKIAKSDGNGNDVPLALWVQFDENRNLIRFYDPDLQAWSEGAPGANLTFESRFAKLYLAQTSVQGSGPRGPSVQITWTVVFKDAAIMNNYKQYLMITDDSGLSTSFDKVGSWSVVR
ncbi:MAG TPA: SBBP repeat-containing protein [Pyrinomonadaceae bacterium]